MTVWASSALQWVWSRVIFMFMVKLLLGFVSELFSKAPFVLILRAVFFCRPAPWPP